MATIRKRGSSWQAQVRREGSPPVSKSFPTKAAAAAWARALEAQIDTADLAPTIRDLRTMTVADLLRRYEEEVTPSIWPWPGKACAGSAEKSFTHLRNWFSWTSRSRDACATLTPRSLIRRTASILHSRPNCRRRIRHLRFHETPNLGVHETGSRPDRPDEAFIAHNREAHVCDGALVGRGGSRGAEPDVGIELLRGDLAPRDGGAEAAQFKPNRVGRLTTSMPAAAMRSRTLRMTGTAVGSSP